MSNPTFASLGGVEIEGSVGEPWDFESDAGPNRISGHVEAVSPSASTSGWLLCQVEPFVHSGRTVDHVVAVLRYASTETFDDFCAGRRIGVNLVFDPSRGVVRSADVSAILATPGHPFLAGSIQIR
jgi:hypothetical protein